MDDVVVISDNSFFLTGFDACYPKDKTLNLINPHQIEIKSLSLKNTKLVFIFISDLETHRKICKMLEDYVGIVRFFFSFSKELFGCDNIFWDPKLKLWMLQINIKRMYIPRVSCMKTSPPKKDSRLFLNMLIGINNYIDWLRLCDLDPKKTHYRHRQLLNSIGFTKVSIHNLFYSQYVVLGLTVLSKVQGNCY